MVIRWPRVLTPTQLSQIIRAQKNPLTALQIFKKAKHKYPNYHHNGPVYATMISTLGNASCINEMRNVIEEMKDDCCESKDHVFANAIRIYGKSGLLDEAVKLFNNLPNFNCVNWTESFNTLLQIMAKESNLEAVYHLFVENSYRWEVKSRVRSLNLLMDALCQINRSDLALQVFQEMNYQCCCPDRRSYQILMRGLCQDGRFFEATHLLYSMFWRISKKGSGGDIVVYRTLLNALCDDGLVEEAGEILGKILRKGLKAPRKCTQKINLGNDIQMAKALINEALIKGCIPSEATYRTLSIDLFAEGKLHEANTVLEDMYSRNFRPSIKIFEAKVGALCGEGKVEEAIMVIQEEMVRANCVSSAGVYNTIIKALCEEGRSAHAISYLEKMEKQVGPTPDKETYEILVDGLCRDTNYVEASKVMNRMLIKSYWPSAESHKTLIKGLCSVGRQYEAVMWLEEMVTQGKVPEASLWSLLVSAVCSKLPYLEYKCFIQG